MVKAYRVLLIALLLVSLLAPGALAKAAGVQLTGRVTGVAGHALAAATVEFYQFGVGRVGTTCTAADGSYGFTIPDDSQAYWVRVWAGGYKVSEMAWVPGSSRFLAVAPEPLNGEAQVRVVDARSGEMIADALVDVQVEGRGRAAQAPQGNRAVTLTVPAESTYQLRVTAPGHAPAVLPQAALAGGAQRPLTLRLPSSTGPVSGIVASALDGAAVAQARVQVIRAGYGVVADAPANSDGAFRFSLPAEAEYQVAVTALNHAPLITAPFTLAGGSVQDFGGEQRLLLTPAGGVLIGDLVGADGRVVAGAVVLLERLPYGIIDTVKTDANGHFAFSNLPAGTGIRYRVQYEGRTGMAGAASDWTELSERAPTIITLHMPSGSFYGSGTGSITGRVVSAGGREVAGQVEVELWHDTRSLVEKAIARDGGSFRFDDVYGNQGSGGYGRPAVPYYLKVSAPGMFTSTLAGEGAIVVAHDQEVAQVVTLYPQRVPMTGRVTDDYGLPVRNVQMRLEPQVGTESLVARTDADGRWQVEADALATYRIEAVAENYFSSVIAGVAPDPTGVTARDIVLHARTATLTGHVADSFGKPVSGSTVLAWSPTAELTAAADADGWYTLTVPAGQVYQLTAFAGSSASGLTPTGEGVPVLAPAPGERVETLLTLWPKNSQVAGTILLSNGEAAPWLPVELMREGEGVVARTTADGQGRFRFDDVDPSFRYTVLVPNLTFRDADNLGLPALFTPQPGTVQNVYLTVEKP